MCNNFKCNWLCFEILICDCHLFKLKLIDLANVVWLSQSNDTKILLILVRVHVDFV